MQPLSQVIRRHAAMLFDFERTLPLLKAIRKKMRPGDIVVDVGCGLGILSLAACHAGAKRVYAIDVDGEAMAFARAQAKRLGMDKKIVWLKDHSFNIDLIEKADLLIQETIGPLAFDENFLPTLLDAKKRFLKKGGKIIPEEVSLCGAPVNAQRKFLCKPKVLALIKTKTAANRNLVIRQSWKIKKGGGPAGILAWPRILWAKGLQTNASPLKKATHWGQALLAGRGQRLTLQFRPHPKDPLHYSEVLWQIR